MFCANCGAKIEDNEKFCGACGTPVKVQSVQPTPVVQQPAPAASKPAQTKGGVKRACFVVGLITVILNILEVSPMFIIGGTAFAIAPLAMMFGADYEDIFGYGFLMFLVAFVLVDIAVASFVLNLCSTKITSKRSASKCRKYRMAAAIMVLIDSGAALAPVIGFTDMVSGTEFIYALFAITFLMAVAFLVLAIITNSKEKKAA